MNGPQNYIEFLRICDMVLNELFENEEFNTIKVILEKYKIEYDNKLIDRIADKLSSENFAEVRHMTSDNTLLLITSWGKDFIQIGGYSTLVKNKLEKEEKEKLLTESTIKSNLTNVRTSRWNLGFAIFNTVFIIINLIFAYLNYIQTKE